MNWWNATAIAAARFHRMGMAIGEMNACLKAAASSNCAGEEGRTMDH